MGEMRRQMSGRPVGVLCSVVVCVCHEPNLERVQPIQAAGNARAANTSRRAAYRAAERGPRTAAATSGEATPRGAFQTAAHLLETTAKYQGLRRLRMSVR